MTPSGNPTMPLTKEDLIQLKHKIDPNDYELVERGEERILVIRSASEFPDIVNDLEVMINKFDMRDTDNLSHACIIGDAEVIGVSLDAIRSIINRRIGDDERIAEDLSEKLIEPYTTLQFQSEEDPNKTLRLGIRVEGNLEDFKPQQLSEVLFSKIKSLPRKSEVVYLIADDGYIRLSGKEFYKQLREFLRENPKINKELASEFVDFARDKLADHFVGEEGGEGIFGMHKQEPINKYITDEEMPDDTVDTESEPEVEPEEKHEIPTVETIPEPTPNLADLKESEEKIPDHQHLETSSEPLESIIEPAKDKESKLKSLLIDHETQVDPESTKKWISQTHLMIKLQRKLSDSGFEIISGVRVPGVDIVANNPGSFIKRIFFSYMPTFNFKKGIELERSLTRFTPDLCIIIGSRDDTDLKLYSVGKNALIVDIDTIINTDYLIHIEEHV